MSKCERVLCLEIFFLTFASVAVNALTVAWCALQLLAWLMLVVMLLERRRRRLALVPAPILSWPAPTFLLFERLEDVPLSFYLLGNAISINRQLMIYDGTAWVYPAC